MVIEELANRLENDINAVHTYINLIKVISENHEYLAKLCNYIKTANKRVKLLKCLMKYTEFRDVISRLAKIFLGEDVDINNIMG